MLSPLPVVEVGPEGSAVDPRRRESYEFIMLLSVSSLRLAAQIKPAWLLTSLLCIGACEEGSATRPDESLGNLVLAPSEENKPLLLEQASEDIEHFQFILNQEHQRIFEVLGPHQVDGTSSMRVVRGNETVEELSDKLSIKINKEGQFQASLDNSKEYGRHAFYDGSELFLRPRFGKYHRREAQNEKEPQSIRNELFAVASDYYDLFAHAVELSDMGAQNYDGRSVRKFRFQASPSPAAPPKQKLSQRKWRESIVVDEVSGEALLDTESALCLSLTFSASVSYERDGEKFTMKLSAERNVREIGKEPEIAFPSEEESMRILARRRELAEREELLKNIAPPAPKAPTPGDEQ